MNNVIMIVAIYLLAINVFGYFIMLIDKKKAERDKYRIPEATLLATAYLGGAIGVYAGMEKFRHKTKKKKFTIGVPVGIIFNFIVFGGILFTFGK